MEAHSTGASTVAPKSETVDPFAYLTVSIGFNRVLVFETGGSHPVVQAELCPWPFPYTKRFLTASADPCVSLLAATKG